MKKYLSLFAAFVITLSFISTSCKKIYHSPHPTPANIRLASYGVVTTKASNMISENYSFSYDDLNRVTGIIYTSNNEYKENENITFSYSGNIIYKTTTSVKPSIFFELDTFFVNSAGQITDAYVNNYHTTFQYFGKLLAQSVQTNELTLAAVTNTYTSYVGNFLENTSSTGAASDSAYTYYAHLDNRIGDYLQIGSFTMYGQNIYRYTNLVQTIVSAADSTVVTYDIDANSNIMGVTAKMTGLSNNDSTAVYTLQYESY